MQNLKLEDLSLEQKIGMLFCARGFGSGEDGQQNREFTLELIRNHALGCVQVGIGDDEFMAKVKEAADYPILIVTDMEMGFPTSKLPPIPLMTLAACNKPEYYRSFARAVVADAKAAGYNGTWGPNLDIKCRYRNLSDKADFVAKASAEIAQVFANNSFLSCGKHYPGGLHRFDTHMANDGSYNTKEELLNEKLVPYFYLMERGLLPTIMVGHSVYPHIDPDNPAVFSKKVIDLIRERGFDGLVWTDSLGMMAILQQYGDDKILGLSIAAGNDIVLPNYRVTMRKNYEQLMQNYKDGMFTEERLNDAVRHVLAAQAIVGAEPPCAEPFTEEDRANYFNIAKDCITAFTDEGLTAALPAENKDRLFIIVTDMSGFTGGNLAAETITRSWYDPERIVAAINREFPEAETVFLPEFPTATENDHALTAATRHKEVVFVTYCNTRPYLGTDCLTRRMEVVINALNNSGKVSAVLHFGNPQALETIDHVPRVIFGYMMPQSQEHAIEVLAGKLEAKGSMPYKLDLK